MSLAWVWPWIEVLAALTLLGFVLSEARPAWREIDASEAKVALGIALGALGLRVAVAVGTYVVLPYGYFAPDELGYAQTGVQLSRRILDLSPALGTQGWFYFNAFLQQALGDDRLVPRLWNAGIGAVTVLLCYMIAARLSNALGARFAATSVAVFPSLVLWSSLNLKDADVWFLLLVGVLLTIRLQSSWRWRSVAAIAVVLWFLTLLRQYAALSLLVATVVGIASPYISRRALLSIVVAGALALAAVALSAGERAYSALHLDTLAITRRDLAVGARSAVDPDPGLQTLHGALAFLPRGLVDLIIRPFPWEAPPALRYEIALETVLYYAILVAALFGMVHLLRTKPVPTAPLAILAGCLALGYALVLSNLGTIYRERAPIVIMLIIFAGATIQRVWPETYRRVTNSRRQLQ